MKQRFIFEVSTAGARQFSGFTGSHTHTGDVFRAFVPTNAAYATWGVRGKGGKFPFIPNAHVD